jgi:hypothetical protein
MRCWIALGLALSIATSPAFADNAYYNRVVPAGGRFTGQYWMAINPDCSLLDYPTAKVVSPPSNGTVSITKGRAFPFFPPANPRSACNRRRAPATMMEYRPARGFVGSDSFTVDVIFPTGAEHTEVYNFTVK